MGHSLPVEVACVSLTVGAFLNADHALGLVKMLTAVQRYLESFRCYLSRSLGVVQRLFVVSMTSWLFVVGLCIAEDKMKTLTQN